MVQLLGDLPRPPFSRHLPYPVFGFNPLHCWTQAEAEGKLWADVQWVYILLHPRRYCCRIQLIRIPPIRSTTSRSEE